MDAMDTYAHRDKVRESVMRVWAGDERLDTWGWQKMDEANSDCFERVLRSRKVKDRQCDDLWEYLERMEKIRNAKVRELWHKALAKKSRELESAGQGGPDHGLARSGEDNVVKGNTTSEEQDVTRITERSEGFVIFTGSQPTS